MEDSVVEKIKFLCAKEASKEWMGYIFYTIKEGKDKVFVHIYDLLLMSIGTSGSDSFNMERTPELRSHFTQYIVDNENLHDKRYGLIHSHNTMGVFFSSTDMSEIEDNITAHYVYTSLIVNNHGEYIVRVFYPVEVKTKSKMSYVFKKLAGVFTNTDDTDHTGLELWYYESRGNYLPDIEVDSQFVAQYNKIKGLNSKSRHVPYFNKGSQMSVPKSHRYTFEDDDDESDPNQLILFGEENISPFDLTPVKCFALDEAYEGTYLIATHELSNLYGADSPHLEMRWTGFIEDYMEDGDYETITRDLISMKEYNSELKNPYLSKFIQIFEKCITDLKEVHGIL